ncbi:hypothetical protein IWW37_005335 [Coemansia sp. RSA 2050]|nr:hypothetical protein IWW37_005335 [Coemansia sp. RSA 2050]KAJ2730346.1 hypothetical protein IW152_005304 [Coemansia sp. BCRC 34962]
MAIRALTARQSMAVAARRRRCLWASATSSDSDLSVAVARCAEQIRQTVVSSSSSSSSSSNHATVSRDACFVSVTPTYSAAAIEQVSSSVSQALRGVSSAVDVVGTVVDQVNGRAGVSLLFYTPRDRPSACAAVPFFIGDEHGRQRLREAAVGRWHLPGRGVYSQASVLPQSATQAASSVRLPPELADIPDPLSVNLLLIASDRETRQVVDALSSGFPSATILGAVGAATPFLNTRPYTLLGPSIRSSGCIGLAFSGSAAPSLNVAHSGVAAATPVLRIVRAKGNVVLEMEDARAAHTLIAAMRSNASGDKRVYARLSRTEAAARESLLQPGPLSAVFRVTGGDPAKGGVAVDTLSDIPPGCFIQFLVSTGMPAATPEPGSGEGPTVVFGVTAEAVGDSSSQLGVYSAATEGGFVYAYPETTTNTTDLFSGPTECAVPGSRATLALPV